MEEEVRGRTFAVAVGLRQSVEVPFAVILRIITTVKVTEDAARKGEIQGLTEERSRRILGTHAHSVIVDLAIGGVFSLVIRAERE